MRCWFFCRKPVNYSKNQGDKKPYSLTNGRGVYFAVGFGTILIILYILRGRKKRNRLPFEFVTLSVVNPEATVWVRLVHEPKAQFTPSKTWEQKYSEMFFRL